MTAILQNKLLEESPLKTFKHKEILEYLSTLAIYYPSIENWYLQKVLPGIQIGKRCVIPIKDEQKIIAIGIGKSDGKEKKICTLSVSEGFRGYGIGTNLLEQLIEWLGTPTPIISVSEEKNEDFTALFSKYGFTLTSIRNGLYRDGKLEYLYNEISPFRMC